MIDCLPEKNLLISIYLQVDRCRKWCINNFELLSFLVSSSRLDFYKFKGREETVVGRKQEENWIAF